MVGDEDQLVKELTHHHTVGKYGHGAVEAQVLPAAGRALEREVVGGGVLLAPPGLELLALALGVVALVVQLLVSVRSPCRVGGGRSVSIMSNG